MRYRALSLVLLSLWGLAAATTLSAAELPKLAVPETCGVNIHFTDPVPGEMKMLAEGAFAGSAWISVGEEPSG